MAKTAFNVRQVCGVDFSAAKLAGRTAWVSTADVLKNGRLSFRSLDRLETLAGSAERDVALRALVDLVLASRDTLWAMDFPFGLPIELGFGEWGEQMDRVAAWPGDAPGFGHHCLAAARERLGVNHVRRLTDVEQKAPFDSYHYRIIYQTFHGMRDVLGPLRNDAKTSILPVKPTKGLSRVVIEACPGSALKRLGLPHQRYKQPAGGRLLPVRRRTRRAIFDGIAPLMELPSTLRRRAMRDSGGDALDALLAALGGWHGYRTLDAAADARYAAEGLIYA